MFVAVFELSNIAHHYYIYYAAKAQADKHTFPPKHILLRTAEHWHLDPQQQSTNGSCRLWNLATPKKSQFLHSSNFTSSNLTNLAVHSQLDVEECGF